MKFLLSLGIACLAMLPIASNAAYSCNISSNGVQTAYDPTVGTTAVVQSFVTLNCTRGSGDSTSMAYSLTADNGMYARGNKNRAFLAPNHHLRYDIYLDSGCGAQWNSNSAFNGPLNFPGGQLSATATLTYWACIGAAQIGPAGIYTDSVNMTLSYGGNPQSRTGPVSFPVAIATPATCALTNPPGTLNFGTYTALSASPATGSTTFGVTCTTYLPYTMTVSPASGSIASVNYTLSLSTSTSSGTGALQSFTVDGVMAAGQAGVCGTATCSGQNTHTLTVSY